MKAPEHRETPTVEFGTIYENGPLSAIERAIIIDAIASALVTSYLTDVEELANAPVASPSGDAR
jgi:hypothetical protein